MFQMVTEPRGVAAVEPVNLAASGTAILGLKASLESGEESAFANSGSTENINDGDLSTRVDTYNGGGAQTVSFVGILWDQPVSLPVVHLDLTLALFSNGGWFGVNNIDPSPGGALTDAYLIEPRLEVTRDNGQTWVPAAAGSDYYAALRGIGIGGGANPNPNTATVRFTLNQPATNINGIRLIGTEGGSVSGGFIGVFELQVRAAGLDSDQDGIEDEWELAHGLKVGSNDAALDPDSDGLTNLQEYTGHSDPQKADTDGDGLNDGAEVAQHHTSPLRTDSDGDGLNDGDEINSRGTNPLAKDTDADGFPDGVEVSQGTDPINAANYPSNLAISGTAILGKKEALESGTETEVTYANSGSTANINDGNLATRVDTYGLALPVSFVGVIWAQPQSRPIVNLDLTFALFSNGGWFGANGIDPGAGGALTTQFLAEPRVEISTDGGASWKVAPHTSDYLAALTGQVIGGGANPNPNKAAATFTLTPPVTNITGIRLVGTDGGTAGGGFLGVFEFAARTSVADSDNDGMDDAWERLNGLIVGTNDASGDADGDGLTNLQEFTDKTEPKLADSDGDGLNDGAEVNTHQTNPLRADTDADGLSDGVEINTHRTNPLVKDTDGDGFSDVQEVTEGTDPKSSASVPRNIAPRGTGILGKKDHIDSGVEGEVPLFNSGSAANINDGNLGTRVDTYGRPDAVSFVGILWDNAVTNPVVELKLTFALFSNGGWFGATSVDPGAGGLLTVDYLEEPRIEVTTDHGATWTVASHTSDYISSLLGKGIGGGAFPNPNNATATFTLTQPAQNIDGVRIIGSNGGSALGGFLGVFDLAVNTAGGVVVRAPNLLNVNMAAGQWRFEFDSQSGVAHVVEFKNSLADASWQTHATIAGDGSRKQVTSPITANQRIFRVLSR